MWRPYHRLIKGNSLLASPRPDERLRAAQTHKDSRRGRRGGSRGRGGNDDGSDWPPFSPGARNAWLLFVTTKPPSWKDNLVTWPETPLTLGEPHEGFYYPDPLGFWAEVRRWSLELFRRQQPAWGLPEALSLTMLVHMGEDAERFHRARQLAQPRTVLFLDEPSWERSGLDGHVRKASHFIADPHRQGQVYEGFWGRDPEGLTVGKAPQHPAMHNLYRSDDMLEFLRSAPTPEGV